MFSQWSLGKLRHGCDREAVDHPSSPQGRYLFSAPHRSAELYSITLCPGRRAPRRFLVAQICNLLYRRIVFCGGLERVSRRVTPNGPPIANRRYSRVQLCATWVAAAPRCAVSQNCILRPVGSSPTPRNSSSPAEYNSAVQQIKNLRYTLRAFRRHGPLADWAFAPNSSSTEVI